MANTDVQTLKAELKQDTIAYKNAVESITQQLETDLVDTTKAEAKKLKKEAKQALVKAEDDFSELKAQIKAEAEKLKANSTANTIVTVAVVTIVVGVIAFAVTHILSKKNKPGKNPPQAS